MGRRLAALSMVVALTGAASARAAEPLACADEALLRSPPTHEPIPFAFENSTQAPIRIYWVDFDGVRSRRGELAPGARTFIPTLRDHVWLLADDRYRCLAAFRVAGRVRGFRLGGPDYAERDLRGWLLRVDPGLAARRPELVDAAARAMDPALALLEARLDPARLAALRQVPIYLREGLGDRMVYVQALGPHLGRMLNAEMSQSIDIPDAANLLTALRSQPMALLHEFTHALQDRFLPRESSRIGDAYRNARARGLYERVRRVDGVIMQAYAMTDEREYLAELSEAYFGRNDFYPFTREELAQYDPEGFRLMQWAWGI